MVKEINNGSLDAGKDLPKDTKAESNSAHGDRPSMTPEIINKEYTLKPNGNHGNTESETKNKSGSKSGSKKNDQFLDQFQNFQQGGAN
eukprot:9277966-Ditylum_brightwellii.AAC.1